MKEKVLKRIQELTEEIEKAIADREARLYALRQLEVNIQEMSASVYELRALIDDEPKSES